MKKTNALDLTTTSLTKKIVVVVVLLGAITSCKKDTVATTETPVVTHAYTGEWKNIVPVTAAGPLDFFNFDIKVDAGGTGVLNSTYIQYNQPYAATNLSWQKIAGDSVVITLNMPAYPDEKWELRGLANGTSNKITADYFSISNNNPTIKHKYGTFVLAKM